VLTLLLVSGLACRQHEPTPPADNRPSLILISIDTLRADHLGCYRYQRPTSPSIDQFAKTAVVFEQLVNPGGATLPVHLSMLTSLPPVVHGIFAQNPQPLPEERITLAEQLSAAGYTTAAFTDGGFVSGQLGFDQGFDHFDDSGGHLEQILPRLEHWLDRNCHRPFFLFLHTYDVHSGKELLPYDSPADFRDLFTQGYDGFTGCIGDRCGSELLAWINSRLRAGDSAATELLSAADLDYLIALYDGGIRHVDYEIGRLLDRLSDRGIYDRSLIILTSDHGEEFFEHGKLLHHQNYEENAVVPLIVKLPDQRSAGARVSALVSTIDIMPTVLDVAGIEPNRQAWGESLLPVIAGSRSGRDFVHMASGPEKLRTDHWSLVLARGKPIGLYDLTSDPGETVDLAADRPAVVAELLALYRSNLKRERAASRAFSNGLPAPTPAELSKELTESLKALGYLQ
jgi:arylsulfatase A-like enzyme